MIPSVFVDSLTNRLNRSISASVIDWFFGPVLCSSRSKRASAAMNGVGMGEELFVVPHAIQRAMSSALAALRAATRALRRCAPCSATKPDAKLQDAWRKTAGREWVETAGLARAHARPERRGLARKPRGHRTPDGVRNTKTPFLSYQNACLHAPWPLCGATSTTRIKRLAWLIRAARAD